MNIEELRDIARTAKNNSLDVSKGENYIIKQNEKAKNAYTSILEINPNDTEAKFYSVYFNACSSDIIDTAANHSEWREKLKTAFLEVMESLDDSTMSDDEKAEMIDDIATRILVLNNRYKEREILGVLLAGAMTINLRPDFEKETISYLLPEVTKLFLENILFIMHFVYKIVEKITDGSEEKNSTKLKAVAIFLCDAANELLVNTPEHSQNINDLLAYNTKIISGYSSSPCFYYIPEPKFDYLEYDALGTMRNNVINYYRKSKLCKIIKEHNSKMKETEISYKREIYKLQTEKYWIENPRLKEELQEKYNKIQTDIDELQQRLDIIRSRITTIKQEYKNRPIISENEGETIKKQLLEHQAYYNTLGIFRFKEKKRVAALIEITKTKLNNNVAKIKEEKEQNEKMLQEAIKNDSQEVKNIERRLKELQNQKSEISRRLNNPLNLESV